MLLCCVVNSLGYFSERRQPSEAHSLVSVGCWPTSDSPDSLSLRSLQDSLTSRCRSRTRSRPMVRRYNSDSLNMNVHEPDVFVAGHVTCATVCSGWPLVWKTWKCHRINESSEKVREMYWCWKTALVELHCLDLQFILLVVINI